MKNLLPHPKASISSETNKDKIAELDVINDYLKNILENITQGILCIGLNGTITICNKAAENILEIQREQVIDQPFWKIFNDKVFGFSMQALLKGEHQTASHWVNYTSPFQHHSELEVITTFACNTSKDKAYQNQGIIMMVRDVTEVPHLQIIAARADRMKVLGEMAAHVAHEIRNPLGGIKGFASLLKKDLADHPEMQKMAAQIVEGADNLNNLVDQILHYTRPIQLHLEKTDLIVLLQEMKQHIMADANIYKSNIAICIDAPFDSLILSLDISHFKSAIFNLIVNALQAMPKGGVITLSVRKQPRHVILSIADTGTGIPEDVIPLLYSPFFTTKPEGNGLGLVEVQKVIQAHRGTIDVASALDKGTIFTIKLPPE